MLSTLAALGSLTACAPVGGQPTPVSGAETSSAAVREIRLTAVIDGTNQTISAATAHGTPLGEATGITVPRVFEVYGVWSGTSDGTGDAPSGLTRVGVLEPARSAQAATSITFASTTRSPFLYFYLAPRYRPDDRTTLAFQLSLAGSG